MNIFLGKGCGEKCKCTELAWNFIQINFIVKKKTFFLHYSRIATPRTRKNMFLNFLVFTGTRRP